MSPGVRLGFKNAGTGFIFGVVLNTTIVKFGGGVTTSFILAMIGLLVLGLVLVLVGTRKVT